MSIFGERYVMLDEVLEHNRRFVAEQRLPTLSHLPRRRTAVVTCMDCRLVGLLEQALGLERGDVVELRTAGATVSAPGREGDGLNSDLIRSLAGAIYLLGVREVLVIGHTNCGLARVEPAALAGSMQALGVEPQGLIERYGLGDQAGLVRWLGAFSDIEGNVREVVQFIRNSPFLPKLPVHGLVIDVVSGKLELVDRDTRPGLAS
uniref:carbonic anhydrase n=1 Tax=Thermogemmatispora argillosa TaxID=2045280 RepID=A0A455T5K4_9CHLR|nr:carbonic anhydrase [Thermogemmatispora argillosa]